MTIQNELKKCSLTLLDYCFLGKYMNINVSLCKGTKSKSIIYLYDIAELKRSESYEDMLQIIEHNSDNMYITLNMNDCEKIGYEFDCDQIVYAELSKYDIMKAFFKSYKYTNLFSKYVNTKFHVHKKGYSGINTLLFSGTLSEIDDHFNLNYESDNEIYPQDLEKALHDKHPLGKGAYYFINEEIIL